MEGHGAMRHNSLNDNFRSYILVAFLILSFTMQGQTLKGGISFKMLRQIEKAQPKSPTLKGLQHSMASNNIDSLALNASRLEQTNPHFMYETVKQNIQNQYESGRCWCFTGLNVLRGAFAKAHQDTMTVEYSRAYLYFYDQLEKSNLMLQGCIDTAYKPMDDTRVTFFFKKPLHDGGTFCGIIDLIRKYGLVPASAQQETYQANHNKKITQLLNRKLRMFGLELRRMVHEGQTETSITKRKTEMLGKVYNMLSLAVGTPVKHFKYAFKNAQGQPVTQEREYTPMTFYKATIGELNYDDYIMVMNDPRRPYYKTYKVLYARHLYDGHDWKYLNLPMKDIETIAVASIKDGIKMYSSYDSEKQRNNSTAYCDLDNYNYDSLFGTSFQMSKADRISTYDSGSTHAMALTAVDLDAQENPIRWKAENTFGPGFGVNGGYVIMSNRWFEAYMFRLVALKKYAPTSLVKAYEQEPTGVYPEDPLFGEDR